MTVQRADINAVFLKVAGHVLNHAGAWTALNALGFATPKPGAQDPVSAFMAGTMSYADVFAYFGV